MEELSHSVNSDSKWLSYIVNQVVANSLNYTEDGGSITFVSEEDEQEKRLLILDTGIGIGQADLRRVFDKGFTGSTGRTHSKFTGMGLFLAKQMALKLGHDLSIQSSEGQGTTLIIHFPKVRNYDDLRWKQVAPNTYMLNICLIRVMCCTLYNIRQANPRFPRECCKNYNNSSQK